MNRHTAAFVELVRSIRAVFANYNIGAYTSIEFEATGYPTHDDFKITFSLYTEKIGHVRGNDPNMVLSEFLRRLGYEETQRPLLVGPVQDFPEPEGESVPPAAPASSGDDDSIPV